MTKITKALWTTLLLALAAPALAQWAPAGDKIKTKWASKIDVNNVLPEYPRPIMQRDRWMNLNGLWDYAITQRGVANPRMSGKKILVPFAVESSLSGVQETVGREKELWYKRTFQTPRDWRNDRVLLHFGAVDWETDVWVNDIHVGSHRGGFTPFSFDITAALKSGNNTLTVKVWDPTDEGYQPRGKQSNRPEGIWYTAVTGIWQTVWLEPVPRSYISDLRITPNVDSKIVTVAPVIVGNTTDLICEVRVLDKGKVIATGKSLAGAPVSISMPHSAQLWSPDNPYIYDLSVAILDGGKKVDEVSSYTAMRKISTRRDNRGIVRLQLNNEDLFQFGPLDQGWWPDGLYTAPTDEALLFDIIKTKELGFNTIRKHVKVEPARWYYYCDLNGMIVWQDMPSGDRGPEWQPHRYFDGSPRIRSAESADNFRREWKEIMDYLYSYPSVAVWVPFNEAWGQFDTKNVVEWTQKYDPSRLVNPASGGNHYQIGDMLDLHNYPEPKLYLYDAERPTVLGEYGGIGWAIEGHLWVPDRNWGYVQFNSAKEVTDKYVEYTDMLKELIKAGFSAAIYTQTTDVEVEVNGLITYDRKMIKVDKNRVYEANSSICRMLSK